MGTPSRVSRFFHRSGLTPSRSTSDEASEGIETTGKVDEFDVSQLLSPQLSDGTSPSISKHITSILHSSFSSLTTGFQAHAEPDGAEPDDSPADDPPKEHEAEAASAAPPTSTVS